MLEKLTKLFLLATAAVLVIAVATTGSSDIVHAAKGGKGGGGGGGKDIGLRVTIENELAAGAPTNIRNDGAGEYVDGQSKVKAVISPTGGGKFNFMSNKSEKVGAGRVVGAVLPDQSACVEDQGGAFPDLGAGASCSGGPCLETNMFTDPPPSFLDLNPGDMALDDMIIRFRGTPWRLRAGGPDDLGHVHILRVSADQWTVTAENSLFYVESLEGIGFVSRWVCPITLNLVLNRK